jgi:hypothetical protein
VEAVSAPRRRGATESLLSIVLVLEAFVVFFVALVVFGLRILPPAAAFGGGALFIVVLVAASRAARYRWGWALGWVLQAALTATGILVPLMYVVGIGFAALFSYCFFTGRRLDRRNARYTDPPEATP